MTIDPTFTALDFVGDIHGHADELKELLTSKLGYAKRNGFYQHPTRKAFFVGDFIDRGPYIKETLEIVRAMIDNGAAYTTIGNHEYNAIAYWTKSADGSPLRPHAEKNTGQHQKTIDAFDDRELLMDYVQWFTTLPIYIETPLFRVVHAQWKSQHIDALKAMKVNSFENTGFLQATARKNSPEHTIIECLLKGEELEIPGVAFRDKDGNDRSSYRVKWWMTGSHLASDETLFEFPDGVYDVKLPSVIQGYNANGIPVFFGHYWLKHSPPVLMQPNVCCLDFSVAKKGKLVAYRWDGERRLEEERLVFVSSR
jgi:hypothetical protein